MLKKIAGYVFAAAFPLFTAAQPQARPEFATVGKVCPDLFLNDVHYYTRDQVSLQDLRGKWLVLSCFNRYCSSCVAQLSATDSLQKQFKDKVQILLIGYSGSIYIPARGPDYKEMRLLYEKVREKEHLQLPIAYDSTVYERFDLGGGTNMIIVDPNGVIRAISNHLAKSDLDSFLEEKEPRLEHAITRTEERNNERAKFSGTWVLHRQKSEFGIAPSSIVPSKFSVRIMPDGVAVAGYEKQRRIYQAGDTLRSVITDGRIRMDFMEWPPAGRLLVKRVLISHMDDVSRIVYKMYEQWELINGGKSLDMRRVVTYSGGAGYSIDVVYDKL
ncbi:MAG: redoxin domain-containing protein [Chitinophagaceae bacterium]|nr:redoxin domain-containing protein [Chitinophagaceae bacterium]